MIVILIGALSAMLAWENRGHRTCVLDGELGQYKCFIGEHSVETGLFHNVYIRLKGQKHGKHVLTFKTVKKEGKGSKQGEQLLVCHVRFRFSSNLGAFWVCRDNVFGWSKSLMLQCHCFPALCAGVTLFSFRYDWLVK